MKRIDNTMYHMNMQIYGMTNVENTPTYFPRLFDGDERVRDISIVETSNGFDIQTVLDLDDIKKEISKFLRTRYQNVNY